MPDYLMGKKTARLSCYLTPELFDAVDDYCNKSHVSKSNFVSMALSSFLQSLQMSQDIVYEVLRDVAQKEVSKTDIEKAMKDVIFEEVMKGVKSGSGEK